MRGVTVPSCQGCDRKQVTSEQTSPLPSHTHSHLPQSPPMRIISLPIFARAPALGKMFFPGNFAGKILPTGFRLIVSTSVPLQIPAVPVLSLFVCSSWERETGSHYSPFASRILCQKVIRDQ